MSRIYLSYLAWPELKDMLAQAGHQICVLSPKQAVSEAISAHPDVYMCKMGTTPRSPVFAGNEALLGPVYPCDVLNNSVVTEKFLICNLKTVSPELIDASKQLYPDIITINVAQGYTKCNMVVVDERHFITEDEGIYKAIEGYNASWRKDQPEAVCLLVRPGSAELPGYTRGVLGGASGRIGNDIWFNGDITIHPDYFKIRAFIDGLGLGIRYVHGKKLTDIGSIIEEEI